MERGSFFIFFIIFYYYPCALRLSTQFRESRRKSAGLLNMVLWVRVPLLVAWICSCFGNSVSDVLILRIGVVFLWYGIIQQSVSLTGNKHWNFIYSALAQIPGYLLTSLALKVGHKVTFLGSILLCSAVSFMFYFTHAGENLAIVFIFTF